MVHIEFSNNESLSSIAHGISMLTNLLDDIYVEVVSDRFNLLNERYNKDEISKETIVLNLKDLRNY